MGKITFQRLTTKRVLAAAPHLRYIAFYHSTENRLNACMRDYADRSFVYILSVMHNEKEYFLYAGKSRAQYARHLTHSKQYAYDYIYLFECAPEYLDDCEKAVIKELKPLFNRACNPQVDRFRRILDIDYETVQNAEMIHGYLERYERYEEMGLFGFALPGAVFTVLEREAEVAGCNCSELLLQILEERFGRSIADALLEEHCQKTNLVTAKTYAAEHSRSVEQIKQYLHQKGRVSGALRIGRDWVIPRDAKFPEDLRGQRTMKTNHAPKSMEKQPEQKHDDCGDTERYTESY